MSKLKCVELKGRGRTRVWSALFYEPEHKQWYTLQGTPNEGALRSVVMQCRRNPGGEGTLVKGSSSAMLGSRTDGAADGSPQRTGSLHQTNGYFSSNAFLLVGSCLTEAQRRSLTAGSKSHLLDMEFVKVVSSNPVLWDLSCS